MSTNNYILTSDGNFMSTQELMHSRNIRYIDLDEDEMMHWKYIKRVKLPNGKYRYYYDESELKKYENEVKQARSKQLNAALRTAIAEEKYSKTSSALVKAVSKHNAALDADDIKSTYHEEVKARQADDAASSELYRAKRDGKQADKLVERATKKYQTKKITSFAERTISKGIVAIANWLSNLGSKKKKK